MKGKEKKRNRAKNKKQKRAKKNTPPQEPLNPHISEVFLFPIFRHPVTDPAPSYIQQVTRLIIRQDKTRHKTRQDAPSPALRLRQGTRYECRCLVLRIGPGGILAKF